MKIEQYNYLKQREEQLEKINEQRLRDPWNNNKRFNNIISIPKRENLKQRIEWWLLEAREWEKSGDAAQRVQAFSYKMNQFWASNVQHGTYS